MTKIKQITLIIGSLILIGLIYMFVFNKPKQVVVQLTAQQKIQSVIEELDTVRKGEINNKSTQNIRLTDEIKEIEENIKKELGIRDEINQTINRNNDCMSILTHYMGTIETATSCNQVVTFKQEAITGSIETGFINNYPSYTPKPYDDPIIITGSDQKKKLTTNYTTKTTTGKKEIKKLSRTKYYNGRGEERSRNETMERYNWNLNPDGASQEYIEIPNNLRTTAERAEYILEQNGRSSGSYIKWDKNAKNIGIKTEFAICLSKSETSLGQANKSSHNYFNCGNNDRGNTVSADNLEHNFRQLSSYCLQNNYQYMKTTLHHLYPNNPASRCLNKRELDVCKYVYASSQYNAGNNIRNCLSQIYDKEITMDYEFRLK